MIIKYTGNRGPAVGRRIYRIGAQSQAPVPVTGASWRFAGLLHDRQARRERRIHGLLHRDLHQPPFPGTGTLQQRSNDAPVKVNSRQEIGNSRPTLHRRAVRRTGNAHRAGPRLNADIHRKAIAVRSTQTKARARSVNQFWIQFAQYVPSNSQSIKYPGSKVFHQHVAVLRQLKQNRFGRRYLEIEHHASLIRIEHGKRQHCSNVDARSQTGQVARSGFDFYDVGPSLGHKPGCIRTQISLA